MGEREETSFIHVCITDITFICLKKVYSSKQKEAVNSARFNFQLSLLVYTLIGGVCYLMVECSWSTLNWSWLRALRCRHRELFAILAFETFVSRMTRTEASGKSTLDNPVVILSGRPLSTEELMIHITDYFRRCGPSLCHAHMVWPWGLICAVHFPWLQGTLSTLS